ncbi:MAG: trimeric intracellular cation channel family protein [Muricoprocola sp.]
MEDMITEFQFCMEIVGTIAFACSGAMVAIRKNLDLLGIVVLGVTTATGGGMIRDLLLGVHPPVLFRKPVYVMVAITAIIILFFLLKFVEPARKILQTEQYDMILNLMDALGLGVFTVAGVNTVMYGNWEDYLFLKVFLGVITGVGGGLLRDIMAMEIPAILKKHIYACASIAGAACYIFLFDKLGQDIAMLVSIALVVIIRVLARHYEWNLPKI